MNDENKKQTDSHNFHEKYDEIFQFPCESKTENMLTTIADFSFQLWTLKVYKIISYFTKICYFNERTDFKNTQKIFSFFSTEIFLKIKVCAYLIILMISFNASIGHCNILQKAWTAFNRNGGMATLESKNRSSIWIISGVQWWA